MTVSIPPLFCQMLVSLAYAVIFLCPPTRAEAEPASDPEAGPGRFFYKIGIEDAE